MSTRSLPHRPSQRPQKSERCGSPSCGAKGEPEWERAPWFGAPEGCPRFEDAGTMIAAEVASTIALLGIGLAGLGARLLPLLLLAMSSGTCGDPSAGPGSAWSTELVRRPSVDINDPGDDMRRRVEPVEDGLDRRHVGWAHDHVDLHVATMPNVRPSTMLPRPPRRGDREAGRDLAQCARYARFGSLRQNHRDELLLDEWHVPPVKHGPCPGVRTKNGRRLARRLRAPRKGRADVGRRLAPDFHDPQL